MPAQQQQQQRRRGGAEPPGGPTTAESVGVIAFLSLALKLLLLPSSQSLEFGRQGAWLATTLYAPVDAWFADDHGYATDANGSAALDCAPGFALFKAFLARLAWALDPELVPDPNAVAETAGGREQVLAIFQRASVIATEQVLLLGVLLYCTTWPSTTTTDMEWSRNKVVVVVALTLFNPGLILVDHIHLHYTGCTVGLMLISVAFLRRDNDAGDLLGAVALVVVVMFDHTLVPPMVPLYLVYLFRHYCSLPPDSGASASRTLLYAPSPGAESGGLASDGFTSEGHEDEDLRRDDGLRHRRQRAAGERPSRRRAGREKDESDDEDDEDEGGPYGTAIPGSGAATSDDAADTKRRRRGHQRAQSEIPSGKRLQAAYAKFKLDASFDKLLTRPRARSNFEFITATARTVSVWRLATLAAVLATSVAAYLAPFWAGGLGPQPLAEQLITRLTAPWALRGGVCRAYWAPNVWALYKGLDRVLFAANVHLDIFDIATDVDTRCSLEEAGACAFLVLPDVHPIVCVALMAAAMYPALRVVWELPHQAVIMPVLVYLMTCSFMLGYHVHEISVLLIILPLTITSCDSTMDARLYLLMSWIAHMSLLPVLKTTDLKAIKPVLLLLHSFGSFIALDQYHVMARQARRIRVEPNGGGVWLRRSDRLYFVGLAFVYLCTEVLSPIVAFLVGSREAAADADLAEDPELARPGSDILPSNLDLVLISVYCAVGLVHSWSLAYRQVSRKVALIESYQWSPKGPRPMRYESALGSLGGSSSMAALDLGPRS